MDTQYGLAVGLNFRETVGEQIALAAKAGFHAVATNWDDGTDVAEWGRIAKDHGLAFHYLHAPFVHADSLWRAGKEGDQYTDRLIRGLDACLAAGTDILVCHVIIGMDRHEPCETGLPRFRRLLDEAQARGIRVAFENTEGTEYLELVMKTFRDHPACRFCWDSGHELCYNFGRDMLALYGDRLAVTHLNDNFGMTDPAEMSWLDDSHVLPGDGIADWEGIRRRLQACGYHGICNLELSAQSRPGRHTHDKYAGMSCLSFLRAALAAIRSRIP